MNAQQLYIVGGRLMGVYFIVSGFASVSAAFFPYFYVLGSASSMEAMKADPLVMLFTGLLHSAAWIIGGFLILRFFGRREIESTPFTTFHSHSFFLSAIKLLGLYWLIDGTINFLRTLSTASTISNGISFHLMSGDLVGWAISALVGFLAIRYAKSVVQLLQLSE
jgi:uncharacterized membrane protein